MINKKIIVLTLLLVILFGVSTVNAANNATSDVADDIVSIEDVDYITEQTENNLINVTDDGTFTALQNKIDNVASGSTITFENDYMYEGGFNTDGILITKDLTIDGNGHTINAQQKARIFNVQSDNVIIKNLTLKNANSNAYGGAISFSSSGTVENCNFYNNAVYSLGGAVYFCNSGSVINCNFIGNNATYDGGAIYFSSSGTTHEVRNCNFVDNKATFYDGGAIYFSSGTVENCNFVNNSASEWGGAIRFTSNGTVTNCKFIGNNATYNGGAIYFSSSGTTHEVRNCNFIGNNATYDGGAIRFRGTGSVTDCNFTNNKAEQGGAISMSSGSVENCNFVNNSASSGGAIYFEGNGVVTNCNFTNNDATYGNGGAVYFSISKYTCNVTECCFVSNTAKYGGAMYQGYTVNCSFVGNHADGDGGAAFNAWVVNSLFEYNSATNGGALSGKKATNCTFNNNTAQKGGAAYNAKVSTNSKFSDNNATIGKDTYDVTWFDIENQFTFYDLSLLINNASTTEIYLDRNYTYDLALDFDYVNGLNINHAVTIHGNGFTLDGDSEARIFNCTNNDVVFKEIIFVNGIAFGNSEGGAIYGECLAVNCTFINNHAKLRGGAMYYGSAVNCTFINNSAWEGGAMYYGSAVNCTFINNSAGDGGAMYYSSGNILGLVYDGSAVNCSFVGNHAGRDGGAMYYGSAVNCSFVGNHADDGGGAAFNGRIVNSLFEYNSATNGGALSGKKATNCTFNNNTAQKGGAVYNAKVSTNSKFSDNNATIGKDTYDVTWFDINQGTFQDLSLLINNASTTEIYLDRNYTYDLAVDFDYVNGLNINHAVTIHGNGFTLDGDNEAHIFNVYNNNVVFKDIIFVNGITYGNSEGGAIYGECLAVNCTFINNHAELRGGAMYGGSAVNCTFIKNDAFEGPSIYGSGGAMYGGSAVNCTFISNSARDGGAMYGGSAVNCTFIKNSAILNPSVTSPDQGRGGAMYGGSAANCNFTGNSAYWGKHIYESSFSNCRFGNPVFMTSNVTKYYGGSQKCIVYLNDDNGPLTDVYVKITINNEIFTVKTDFNGQIGVDLNLSVGEYNLTAVYENILAISKVTVKSTVVTEDISGTYLNSKVNASFLNTDGNALSGKQVSFNIGDKTFSATTDGNGVATVNVDLDVGNYTVTAVNPETNEKRQFKLVIDKANAAISLTLAQNNKVTTLTATLMPANVSGIVVFNVNGGDKTVAINGGKAILTFADLEPGAYTVTASYGGNNNLNVSKSNTVNFSIEEAYPILTANPVTKTYGTSSKLVIDLSDSKGNKITNANVKVVIGSEVKTIKTNAEGKATMDIVNAPGTYTATITYADAKTTVKVTVKKATPKLTAKAKTFKKSVKTKKYAVTLKTNKNKVMKNIWVTLKVNKKTYKVKTNTNGQATFKITNLKKNGKFTATVKYEGNKYYNAVTVKLKITIK